MTMAFDSTITEQDLDSGTQQYLQGLGDDAGNHEPDLDVDDLKVLRGALARRRSRQRGAARGPCYGE